MSRITLSERTAIEVGIYARHTLQQIAEKIGRTVKTVSLEIRKNSTKVQGLRPYGKDCRNTTACKRKGLCGDKFCQERCVTCKDVDCQTVCRAY